MNDSISRRDVLKGLGVVSASRLLKSVNAEEAVKTSGVPEINHPLPRVVLTSPSLKDGEITPLTSTSEVFIPPRGRGFMKFSFDFPEPVVALGEHRFGFLVFTAENTYGLAAAAFTNQVSGASIRKRSRSTRTLFPLSRSSMIPSQSTAM